MTEASCQLAGREDADRLTALEALAARSGLTIAKHIASYYRIALHIGWQYTTVLKYRGLSVDFINLVSGRTRMALANLVFRTFNIPSKQVCNRLELFSISLTLFQSLTWFSNGWADFNAVFFDTLTKKKKQFEQAYVPTRQQMWYWPEIIENIPSLLTHHYYMCNFTLSIIEKHWSN